MRVRTRSFILPLILLVAAAGFAAEDRLTRALGGPPEQARLVAEERRLTDLINEERKQRGRIRLVALNQDIVTRDERLEQHPQLVRCR